jgi:hypothetical protein
MKIKRGKKREYAKYVEINSKDGYSRAVVDFGEHWAGLMEIEIAKGKTVAQCAEKTSHEAAKKYEITGFMYGAAAAALSKWWIHGNELRAWHNAKYLDEDEAKKASKRGRVVNPAVLTVKG